MIAPEIPNGWNACSFEQLIHIYEICQKYASSRSERNLALWLYFADMEVDPKESKIENGKRIYAFRYNDKKKCPDERMVTDTETLSLFLDGVHVKRVNGTKVSGEEAKIEQPGLFDWVDLPFGDENHNGLLQFPLEHIKLFGKRFQFPSQLITNITYEQYVNMQKLMEVVATESEQISDLQQQLKETSSELDLALLNSDLALSKKKEKEMKSICDNISSRVNDLEMYKARFVSHALCRCRFNPLKQDWLGNLFAHGLKFKNYRFRYTSNYNSSDAEANTPFMNQHAYEWMYNYLSQLLLSCLQVYRQQFPDLFSKYSSGESHTMPLIAEVDTVNAIMKWQSYPNQQQVYDTNAIQVFGILNSMTREAKQMEEISKSSARI